MTILSSFSFLAVYSVCVASVEWAVTCRLKPGLQRLLATLPLMVSSVFPSELFDRENPYEAILYYYCVLNYVWLLNCKLLMLATNRGPLTKVEGQPVLFAWLLLFPINFKIPTTSQDLKCHPPATVLASVFSKVLGCVLFARAVVAFWEFGFLRDVCLTWLMYFLLTVVMEMAAELSLAVLGIQLMPHFNQPWLTTSFSEFWSTRWNLVIGGMLKDFVYDTIMEGRFIKEENSKPAKRRPLRQMVAVLSTFLVSGLMHWGLIYYVTGVPAWYNLACFCIHGCLVIGERMATIFLRKLPRWEAGLKLVPWSVRIVVMQFMLHWLAHAFFWKEMVQSPEARDLANAIDVLQPFFSQHI